jgi:hypothetical protein
MSDTSNEGIKTGTFDTWAKTEPKQSANVKAVPIKVDNRAATRQAIIVDLRKKGFTFKTRSDWRAKEVAVSPQSDWNYKSVALHHAGNSFSCAADGSDQLRKAEATDIDSFGQISYHYAIDCQGIIYEALDIRYKGAHIEGGNSGVIGVVFLADLSIHGEAKKYGPGAGNVAKKRGLFSGIKEWIGEQRDLHDTSNDQGTELHHKAASALLHTLKHYFPIETLGGHREFAKTKGTSRACPGAWGLVIVDILQQELCLLAP